ncbi:hypothetical protein B0T17DRAFT_539419 [Bombardia bombarda]|uniref:Uncharacterized protein n=1 Tax=Bombardia bombarda TaxID=252184 RepID=A0AA39WI67_9PEZI|nr:hypothetical protein B0T17DRAFT_539419 [Bombardia bombarda]
MYMPYPGCLEPRWAVGGVGRRVRTLLISALLFSFHLHTSTASSLGNMTRMVSSSGPAFPVSYCVLKRKKEAKTDQPPRQIGIYRVNKPGPTLVGCRRQAYF